MKIPKTAGTSVLDSMLRRHGFSREEWSQDVVTNINALSDFSISDRFRIPGRTKKFNRWHMSARDMRRVLGDEWRRYVSFTVVRNPFDRTVSSYEFQRAKASGVGTFEQFVDDLVEAPERLPPQAQLHAIAQLDWTSDDDAIIVDHVIRFESLHHDLGRFTRQAGLAPSELGHENVTERTDWPGYYTPRTARVIVDHYAADFATFGYSTTLP